MTDDSDAIQRAIQDGQASGQTILFFPPGTYRVAQLELASNLTLLGQGAILKTTARKGNIFRGQAVQNIRIKGLTFTAGNADVAAIMLHAASQVRIEDCRTIGATLLSTMEDWQYARTISEAQLCHHLHIAGNTCQGHGDQRGKACILLRYCRDCVVHRNHIRGYPHGIQWWGGDSNPARDGILPAPRWARRIHVDENLVTDISSGGGIWGSMGEHVTVQRNYVANCGDVGIDFEGCFFCLAQKNRVFNCKNGGITTFFLNRDIRISQNRVSTNVPGQPVLKIYNSTQSQANRSVYVVANRFEGNGVLAQIRSEAVDTLVFDRNDCRNVIVDLNANNNHNTYIRDNAIRIFRTASRPFTCLVTGSHNSGGSAWISGNKILSLAPQPAGSIGLAADEADYNSPAYLVIARNQIAGFWIDLQTANHSLNTGIRPVFVITSNILGRGVYRVADRKGNHSDIRLQGNQDASGKPVLKAAPAV